MNIYKFRKRFILFFIIGKLFLIGLCFLLDCVDAYGFYEIQLTIKSSNETRSININEMMDVVAIISTTLLASFIIMLNYLKSIRAVDDLSSNEKVSRTEVFVVFLALVFYIGIITISLLSLQAADPAFIDLKRRIAFIEILVGGGILGWVISDLRADTKLPQA